jgi:hydrogenase maturation factor
VVRAAAPLGKIDPATFERLIAPHLGAARTEVVVGPRAGADCGVVRIGNGRVLAMTTDPLSIVPALGPEISARMACHLIASDLWTSAIPPAWAAVTLNLPPHLSDADLERYARAMSDEWSRLGVAVVTGHTGRYPGCEYSIVGAATLVGIGDETAWRTPAGARIGDRVLLTKGCAIEATAIAAHLIPERLTPRLGAAGVARARAWVSQVSVVAECRALLHAAAREHGVSALHDATEGGVLGGLLELARACGGDLRVERARVPLAEEARAACEAWGGIDPYWTLSEGALIAAVKPGLVPEALAALAREGIAAAEIGEIAPGSGRLLVLEPDGAITTIEKPEPDPYWSAYARFAG